LTPTPPFRSKPLAAIPLFALLVAGAAPCAHAQSPAAAKEPTKQESEPELPAVKATAKAESATGKESVRATTTAIGKGQTELRDVPQSLTVITERLLDERDLDTLKEALRTVGGISFQAAEGGEEDIRLRGFSLQASGDIFLDGIRDPAFYERDSFNWDRLEVLRGSASMLFGRGSTGGVVNQVSKWPLVFADNEVALTVGSGRSYRVTADVNAKTGEDAAFRVNAMFNQADLWGAGIDKYGVAPAFRWGIGTRHEFTVGAYYLRNDNGINYGLPWLSPGPEGGGDYLWSTPPENYYGMRSDYNETGTTQGNFTYVYRMDVGQELRTAVRVATYERDQRASAIRFAAASLQPDGRPVTAETFGGASVLTRGTNIKIQNMDTVYAQSDYNGRHRWFGLGHSVQAGIDYADEDFENLAASVPAGVSLVKPRTTVGTPNDGATIDEGARELTVNRTFRNRAAGVYAQDLVEVAPTWKLLGGLRWDYIDGEYRNLTIAAPPTNPCAVQPQSSVGRNDSLPSGRAGVLFQPSERQTWYASYGTSYNTSGDAYQYDAGTVDVDPEKSRNVELGGYVIDASGRLSTRVALFHTTKYNERNRDADTVNACNYVLSGKRHAAGIDLDVAGRITPQWEVFVSLAWIPIAEVDSSSGAPGTEVAGSRPGLTPRWSGSLWATYRVTPKLRVGAGLTGRSADKPVGLAAASPIEAPGYLTGDVMAEYDFGDVLLRANVFNVSDDHYASYLYRGHYVAGQPRTLEVTLAYRF
jgi:catecholate siderophore receptor